MDKKFSAELDFILNEFQKYYPNLGDNWDRKIRESFWFAKAAHEGQKRESGKAYFWHPIGATKILLKIKPDKDTLCACLMHDVIEDTPITADDIENRFGRKVRFLCEGVEKVSKARISEDDIDQKKFENVQKLFIAMAKDIRVIFIKLADRIHNLQTLKHVRPDKRERIARESLEVYAPVADRLGLHEFKTQIEELCFENLYPTEYEKLVNQITHSKKIRGKFLQMAKEEITEEFDSLGFSVEEISVRQKELFSMFQKMKRKSINSVNDVYDFLGMRIVVSSTEDCYRALGYIHSRWKPITARFKDYIALPKPNGYQSLHTTVLGIGQDTLPTEIQIRTRQMDTDAELGPAAHWAYKQKGNSNFDEFYIKKTAWLPKRIAHDAELSPDQFFRHISDSVFSERIYVFTPKGDVKFFPKDATPVDFAYAVHTDVGHSCVGAKVNGVIKPLNYKLRNNDVVSILTKKGRRPNALWLNFVKSNSARDKIRGFLRQENEPDAPYKTESPEINETKKQLNALERKIPRLEKIPRNFYQIVIGGERNLSHKFSPCCQAQNAENIIAYKSRGLKFTIHRQECKELESLDPERFLEAYLQKPKEITAHFSDGPGILMRITSAALDHGINIEDLRIIRQPEDPIVAIELKLLTRSDREFQNLLRQIERINSFVRFEEK